MGLFGTGCTSSSMRPLPHCMRSDGLMQSEKGTPEDKLRAALVYLLTCDSLPSDSEYENISKSLQVRLTLQKESFLGMLPHTHIALSISMISAQTALACSLELHMRPCPVFHITH